MSEEIAALSYTTSPLVYYNTNSSNPGVYIEWERVNSTGVRFYKIQKSDFFDGDYSTIDTVLWPCNEYVDTSGTPAQYYRIQEVDSSGTVLSTSAPILGDELLIKSSLRFELEHLLNIPIYDEEVIFRKSRTEATVSFPYWSYFPRPDVRISGYSEQGDRDPMIQLSEVDPVYRTINASYDPVAFNRDGIQTPYTGGNNYSNGLKVKYDYKGNIFFINENGSPISIQSYDTVLVSYTVKMFTSQQMNSALNMALQTINSMPGASKYQYVASVPFYYDPAIVYGAAYYLIRGLILSLTNRQRRLLIEDPDASFVENLKSVAQMYKDDFDKMLEKLPIARYPGVRSVVVPEYNMPGGRSRFFRYIWNIGTSS